MTEPDGLAYWESLGDLPRRELPVRTRDALRWWRLKPWPPVEWWTGPVDWVYCPAEYVVPTRKARRAVTSHDVLQDLRYGAPRRRERAGQTSSAQADLILSVSRFNTERLLEAFPGCRGRVAYVPNARRGPVLRAGRPPRERAAVRADLGLPPGVPYLLSVANFQPRKNLARLIRAAAPAARGGRRASWPWSCSATGSEAEARPLREAIAAAGRRALIRLPGYRQGRALRAAYAEATALVFPSTLRELRHPGRRGDGPGHPRRPGRLDRPARDRRRGRLVLRPRATRTPSPPPSATSSTAPTSAPAASTLGRTIAEDYRWQAANDRLVEALAAYLDRPRRSGRPRPGTGLGRRSRPSS